MRKMVKGRRRRRNQMEILQSDLCISFCPVLHSVTKYSYFSHLWRCLFFLASSGFLREKILRNRNSNLFRLFFGLFRETSTKCIFSCFFSCFGLIRYRNLTIFQNKLKNNGKKVTSLLNYPEELTDKVIQL
jgi:hypothetical protein